MYHPRHVLWSDSCLSPTGFLKDIVLSHFRVSDVCSGQKILLMTNRAAIFERSIKCSPSAVLVAMLLMNPPVDASVGTTSTTKGYSFSRGLVVCCLSSRGSKDRCGEFRPYVSQDLSWSRFFLDLLPLNWQSYILLVQVWCQRVTSGRERLACLILLWISTRLSHLHVSEGRLHPGMYFQ